MESLFLSRMKNWAAQRLHEPIACSFSKDMHKRGKELNPEISLFTCSTQECQGILIAVNGWFELCCIVNMSSSVCPCTLLELHVGSPRQQPTGAISAHVMALTHKPSFGRSMSQKLPVNCSFVQKEITKQKEIFDLVDPRTKQWRQSFEF